jgi:tRNA (mo5U34)-methyltransferase
LRASAPQDAWLLSLSELADETLSRNTHGDLPRWREALASLPPARQGMRIAGGTAVLGEPADDVAALRDTLMAFHPWRKGPLQLGGVAIDTEWRSDWKWERVRGHIDLRGARVLDIGCGNGYFGWRMLAEGASLVVGIDPTLVFVMQWLACRHFAGTPSNYVLPLGIEELGPDGAPAFDAVFSMGVLYHRRDPLEHLRHLRTLLKPGGTLVLETLVWPEGAGGKQWSPPDRYARMRNVWAVPPALEIEQWLEATGYRDGRLLDVNRTSIDEQRGTEWMRFESLPEALDPANPALTIEGYPAPTRALFCAIGS